jgi:hypothetical protein
MSERTPIGTHRQTVNAILESRARVTAAATTMSEALTSAARVLVRAASLDAEYTDALGTDAPTPVKRSVLVNGKAKRKAKRKATTQPTLTSTPAVADAAHASAFATVGTDAPAQTHAPRTTIAMPAARPYVGTDATAKVYDAIMAALTSTDESAPSVHAVANYRATVRKSGIVRVVVDLRNVIPTKAYVGQSADVWGSAIATTVRPNPSPNARRKRITYAPLTADLDCAFYLVTPTKAARGDAYPMPDAPHLRKHADAHALGIPVDAASNWRLSVKSGYLRVDFALPTYANVVTVKRGRNWGSCVATTRHAGTRRIAKSITLGPSLVLLLDVIARTSTRRG